MPAAITAAETSVFPRYLDLVYPSIERGRGVRLYQAGGLEVLDAASGGAMVACLGHAVDRIVDAAVAQAGRLSYVYNHHFTNDAQEELATRLIREAAPEMARVRFVSGGSEANEAALRLVRQYHVERGQPQRWRVISPTQAYYGATMGALSLTGRSVVQHPFESYLAEHLHLSTGAFRADPSGEAALAEFDRLLEDAGDSVAAFFCEPVSAAALPAFSPPSTFWQGVEKRRREHGFLVCFDEIVTGMGRTGSWFAYQQIPLGPDIVTGGKGLGAGYFPLAGMLCRAGVYDVIASGSREFEHGHTWDGAPLPMAIGLAVLDFLQEQGLVDRVRERGPSLRSELEQAVGDLDIVREVRGRGFLLGVELVDPRDGESPLPSELRAAELVDQTAFKHGVLVTSSYGSAEERIGDQVLLAPAYTSSDKELGGMVERLAAALAGVQRILEPHLVRPRSSYDGA
jgi:adenosylmethionine-8-amino-7-oxononanoate aminotransferase